MLVFIIYAHWIEPNQIKRKKCSEPVLLVRPIWFGLVSRAPQAFKKITFQAKQNYLVSLFINRTGKSNCKIVPNRNRKWGITFEVVNKTVPMIHPFKHDIFGSKKNLTRPTSLLSRCQAARPNHLKHLMYIVLASQLSWWNLLANHGSPHIKFEHKWDHLGTTRALYMHIYAMCQSPEINEKTERAVNPFLMNFCLENENLGC